MRLGPFGGAQSTSAVIWVWALAYLGLVGLAALAVSWAVLLRDGYRLARWHPDPRGRALVAGITAAVVSMLAVTAINPFINSAPGLYFQSLAAALVVGVARWTEPDPPQDTGGR